MEKAKAKEWVKVMEYFKNNSISTVKTALFLNKTIQNKSPNKSSKNWNKNL